MMLITVMDLSADIGDNTDTKEMEKMAEAAKDVRVPELKLPGEEGEEAGADLPADTDGSAPESAGEPKNEGGAEDAESADNTERTERTDNTEG